MTIIAALPSWKVNHIRMAALITSLLTFLFSLGLWLAFDPSTADFQLGYDVGKFWLWWPIQF